jgi:preprotein translocase SecE subunit
MSKVTNYLKEVKAEMAHVSFPTRKKAMMFAGIVIVISLGVSLYLGLADYVFRIVLGSFFK